MVERSAVNRNVRGSSPLRGAKARRFQKCDTPEWPEPKEGLTMKRYWPAILCAVLMIGSITMEARAQVQEADAYVAAAKAALSTENPKPWQTFNSLFRTVCTPPRKDARPPKIGPGEPDEKA